MLEFLGSKIRYIREELGISQKDMAKALSMSNNTLSQYENSKRTPDFVTLKQMAEYLEVSLDYLAGFVDTPYNPLEVGFQTMISTYFSLNEEERTEVVNNMGNFPREDNRYGR